MPYIRRGAHISQEPVEATIKYIAREPSSCSRLGEIGYLDKKGMWHGVVNIFDQGSCRLLGIKALRLANDWLQYITHGQYNISQKPWIDLYPGGSYQLVSPNELQRSAF
jgi:hypothetical protein